MPGSEGVCGVNTRATHSAPAAGCSASRRLNTATSPTGGPAPPPPPAAAFSAPVWTVALPHDVQFWLICAQPSTFAMLPAPRATTVLEPTTMPPAVTASVRNT